MNGRYPAEGGHMSETRFLTPEEVAERYRGSISVGNRSFSESMSMRGNR